MNLHPLRINPRIFLLIAFAALSFISACTTSGTKLPVSEGTAAIGSDNTQNIELRVESFFFKPNRIVVYVDSPVRLTLKSGAFIIPHNFTLYAPEAGIEIDQNIGHGQTKVVTFTPTKIGEYSFYCGKGSHAQKGMTGTLVVKARE